MEGANTLKLNFHSLFLVLQFVSRAQLSVTPMDCNPPGSSAHGIFQARILEWVAHSLLQGTFLKPRIEAGSPALQADSLPFKPLEQPLLNHFFHLYISVSLL